MGATRVTDRSGRDGGTTTRSERDGGTATTRVTMTSRERTMGAVIAVVAGLGGAVAVYLTDNEVGSATLLVVGVYFTVATVLGRFPRLKVGDNEIDPQALEEAREESGDAKINSEDAKEGLADARRRLELLEAAVLGDAAATSRRGARLSLAAGEPAAPEELLRLAQRYDDVRWTEPSGPARTGHMTTIVDEMVAVARATPVADVVALLRSGDPGLNLAGIAALHARPDPAALDDLVRLALTPDKPFNEYWALVALRRVLREHCDRLTATMRVALVRRLGALPRGSDRAREIEGILADCP